MLDHTVLLQKLSKFQRFGYGHKIIAYYTLLLFERSHLDVYLNKTILDKTISFTEKMKRMNIDR